MIRIARLAGVALGVAMLSAFAVVLPAGAQTGIFSSASYSATQQFTDVLGSTTMTLAYDGTDYWSTSGGGAGGVREARYNALGTSTGTFSPGLDFRSDFTDAAGNLYARQYANSTIYKQNSPGSFSSFATLSGGTLDVQSSVVLNGNKTAYVAMTGGVVSTWSLAGTFLGTTTLNGFGTMNGEGLYPASRGIASDGAYFLTYSNGALSAWDITGNRVGMTTLVAAGNSFDSNFSLSFANNKVWINDFAGGSWRGYDVVVGSDVVPEGSSLLMLSFGIFPLAVCLMRKLRKA